MLPVFSLCSITWRLVLNVRVSLRNWVHPRVSNAPFKAFPKARISKIEFLQAWLISVRKEQRADPHGNPGCSCRFLPLSCLYLFGE